MPGKKNKSAANAAKAAAHAKAAAAAAAAAQAPPPPAPEVPAAPAAQDAPAAPNGEQQVPLGVMHGLNKMLQMLETNGPDSVLQEIQRFSSPEHLSKLNRDFSIDNPIAALEELGEVLKQGRAVGDGDALAGLGANTLDQITREVMTDERSARAIMRALQPLDGVDVTIEKVGSEEEADDDEWLDAPDDGEIDTQAQVANALENGAGVDMHEDDLVQINTMIGKLGPLSLETLEELSKQWNVSFPTGGDHLLYRTNITERIRYMSALVVVGIANRFHCLHNTPIHNSAEDIMLLVNNLVLSLWHAIGLLSDSVRKNVAVIFDLDPNASAHEICVVAAGLGITTFFRSLPISLLENICKELRITPKQKDKIDVDILHEVLTHQICGYLYPPLSSRQNMSLRCATNITVHENGPGSFTCTIENSWMMGLVLRDLYTSNTFTCNKVKWRAQVAITQNFLTFIVNQRSKSFNVKMTIRSAGKKKNKKNAPPANNTDDKAQPLHLEATMLSTPKNHIGFENIVTVREMFAARTDLPTGMKLYNKAEDKVTFQFTLEATQVETPPAEKEDVSINSKKSTPPAEEIEQPEKGGKKKSKVEKKATEEKGQTIADLIAQEEEEKREKANKKQREKFEKKRTAIESEENKARDKITVSFNGATSQIQDEWNRSFNKATQKTREREKKELAILMQPSQELQQQLAQKMHEVQLKRQTVGKLNQEDKANKKQLAKVMEKLEARRAELEQLKADFESNTAEVDSIEKEIKDVHEQKTTQEEEVKRRAEARSKLKFEAEAAPAPTAAIKDFQSFWSAPSGSDASSPFLGPTILGSSADAAFAPATESAFASATVDSAFAPSATDAAFAPTQSLSGPNSRANSMHSLTSPGSLFGGPREPVPSQTQSTSSDAWLGALPPTPPSMNQQQVSPPSVPPPTSNNDPFGSFSVEASPSMIGFQGNPPPSNGGFGVQGGPNPNSQHGNHMPHNRMNNQSHQHGHHHGGGHHGGYNHHGHGHGRGGYRGGRGRGGGGGGAGAWGSQY